ncbi:MAG: NAD(P)-dependent oxidoreductase [Myxococcota bacterium]
MVVLRWGQAEYERAPLSGLPEGCEVVTAAGEDAPLEEAHVVVVPSVTKVTAAHVPRLARCKLVLTTTSGFDHVDVAAVQAAGIPVARLPLARRDAVVETALGMMLSLSRRLGSLGEAAQLGRWDRGRLDAHGATLLGRVGVVGVGVIGARMVEVLRALGAEVVECRRGEPVPYDVDVLTLHCGMEPANLRLVDPRRLREGAILVNTARGKLLDVDAAVAAVRSGHLAGLGVDVFPTEPAALSRWTHPRVILTPHAAGWHPRLGEMVSEGVAVAVRALLAGGPVPYALTPRTPTA